MYTIGRLSKRARVKPDCIRFYERQGLLAAASKTPSGYHLYTELTLRQIVFIKHAQRCGLSLAEIRELLQLHAAAPEERAAALRRVAQKKRELDTTISTLHAMSAALGSLLTTSAQERDAMAAASNGESPLLATLEACLNVEAAPAVSAAPYGISNAGKVQSRQHNAPEHGALSRVLRV